MIIRNHRRKECKRVNGKIHAITKDCEETGKSHQGNRVNPYSEMRKPLLIRIYLCQDFRYDIKKS